MNMDTRLYETWVQKMADALHKDCELLAQGRYALDPVPDPWQGDLHDATRHYGQAHDLVRRLWPEWDDEGAPGVSPSTGDDE